MAKSKFNIASTPLLARFRPLQRSSKREHERPLRSKEPLALFASSYGAHNATWHRRRAIHLVWSTNDIFNPITEVNLYLEKRPVSLKILRTRAILYEREFVNLTRWP